MNTGKQINSMIALMLLLLLLVGVYTIWDPFRAEATAERTHEEVAERGAKVYLRNCRSCHGNTGEGRIGPALNPEIRANNPNLRNFADPNALAETERIVRYTIECGRIGTIMPPWSDKHGGSLNDEQIRQLVTLITDPPEGLWDRLPEIAEAIHEAPELPAIEEITSGATATGATSYVCGQLAPAQPEETGPVEVRTQWEVIATDNRFNVRRMGVPAGQPFTVRLQNNGQALHNWNVQGVQSANGQPIIVGTPPTFIAGGQSASGTFTITAPGNYNFICGVRPVEMRGTLVVQEGGAPTASPGPSPAAGPSPSPAPTPSPGASPTPSPGAAGASPSPPSAATGSPSPSPTSSP
jgi:mono/diheme cytochrome c family protein/plastocyanin